MPNNLTNHVKTATLLFGIAALLWNCEQETGLDPESQNSAYIVAHKNYDFIAQNNSLLHKVSSLSKKKANSASRGNTVNANDFTIFTDRLTYMAPADGSRASYSFYLKRNSGTQANQIENLILSKKSGEDQYKAYIITYFFPGGLHGKHDNFEIINFEEIDAESISGLYAKSAGCENTYEYIVVETKHECYSGEHSGAGETENCNYESNGGTPPYSTWAIHVSVNYVCDDGGSGGGGTPGASANTDPAANPNQIDTGITLPPGCQDNNCTELVANQVNDLLDSALSYNDLLWLNDNPEEADAIQSFLGDNPTFQEQNLAKEIISSGLDGTLISAFPFVKYPPNSNYATLYPKLTEYLKNQLPALKNNNTIINAIKTYTNQTTTQIQQHLQWGKGPTIKIEQLGAAYGKFKKNADPNSLYLDIDLVNQLENTTPGSSLADAFAFLIGVTVLHEYVHYGDYNYNGDLWQYPQEEGLLFENDVYGQSVWISNAEIILKNNN